MSRLRILAAGLTCGLIISLAVNVGVAWELMELYREREIYRDLSRNYDKLQASCLSLLESYRELKAKLNESLSPSNPPISKSEAIDIALEYGGWNETTLKDMRVSAGLNYVMFHNSSYWGYGFTPLHDVTGYVSDYSPYETCSGRDHYAYDCITHRYVWTVVVQEAGYVLSIPPPGQYFVDAATGEVTSYDDMMLGKGWERLEIPGWIMAEKCGYISDDEIVQVTASDLLSYPKLDLALQEAEIASLKHLAHPLEMIKLTNSEAKAIVEFLTGKQANATEYMFAVNYNETLYSVFMIFTWTQPIIS